MANFKLEIYVPDSEKTIIWDKSQQEPFPHFSIGEIVNYGFIVEGGKQSDRMRITEIEHILADIEGEPTYKTMIYGAQVT